MTGGAFACDICHKVFDKRPNLKVHMKTHGEKTVPCEMCDLKFLNRSTLNVHMRVHLKIKKFSCADCGACFTTSTHLTSHRRTHTAERPYKCEYCPKAFTVSNALTVHRRIHTGERPFQCNYCPKAFYESGKLRIHERAHTGVKPYSCDQCGQQFSQKGNLRTHTRIAHAGNPKNFKCDLCEKTFNSKAYLKLHHKFHLGEKSEECDICHKQFVTVVELKIHQNYHKGNKLFKCEICGKEMYQSAHLKRHLKMHNTDKTQCNQCKRFVTAARFKWHKCPDITDSRKQNLGPKKNQKNVAALPPKKVVEPNPRAEAGDGPAPAAPPKEAVRPAAEESVAREQSESMMVSFIGNIKQEPDEEEAVDDVEEEMEKLFSGLYPNPDQPIAAHQDIPDQILSAVEPDSDGSEEGEVTFNVNSLKQRIEQLKYQGDGTQPCNIQQGLGDKAKQIILDWNDC